ncbi:hypothetical protein RUM43_003288 [Polyplax serrata]|uniref:Uncharacterized protein n=1 Tax=Polyplax serrata TaxID=468196 RepID=A0AAN8PH69_POLSC
MIEFNTNSFTRQKKDTECTQTNADADWPLLKELGAVETTPTPEDRWKPSADGLNYETIEIFPVVACYSLLGKDAFA